MFFSIINIHRKHAGFLLFIIYIFITKLNEFY